MVKNRKSEHHHRILLIQISLATKFQLKLTILIFLTRFVQKGFFWSKTEKVNTTYFLHNSAYSNQSSAKFQLKLAILKFSTKFTQKRYFQLETEQAVLGLQVLAFSKVKTVVFKHFEDLKDLIILHILKEKLVMLCLPGSFFLKIV